MKKLILFIVVLFTFGYTQAQIRGGIKAGLNFSQLDIDAPGTNESNRTGFHAGAFAEISVAGFGILGEVLFSKQGTELDDGTEFDLSYVQVPILFKKSFVKVLNVHVGPQFGFLTDAVNENDEDIGDFLKGSDVSLVLGAGVDLPLGVSGGVRYVYGLSNIDDGPLDTEINSRMVQVYVGYRLFGN